jgi:hypothetical protein
MSSSSACPKLHGMLIGTVLVFKVYVTMTFELSALKSRGHLLPMTNEL